MMKQKVLLTGAAGGMGFKTFTELLKRTNIQEVTAFVLDNEANRLKMSQYENTEGVRIWYGDFMNYKEALEVVKDVDLVLHTAALVSPYVDDTPELAMKINIGLMHNLIKSIKEHGQETKTKVVFVGTVAQTGDRMPPMHWGRIGDPLKTSVYDYYAVSKVAAERALVESGIKYWVSLRQTGIMGANMVNAMDPIIFHNCLNNVLEYVSDRDSGRLLGNLSAQNAMAELDESFWGHMYNIGGGESCRVSTLDLYTVIFGELGIKDLKYVIDPKMFATTNFHGQYYLDSDRLEDLFHFRHDTMTYFYDLYLEDVGKFNQRMSQLICKFPGGQFLMGKIIKKSFGKLALKNRGTIKFIKEDKTDEINAYWGSKKQWSLLPDNVNEFDVFNKWDQVVEVDHGYDESKAEEELDLDMVKGAAVFRGGECKSLKMTKGDWISKLEFRCAFGHTFKASPRLILEGGHWCPHCEKESWSYSDRAQVDPFFAQVWYPLHDESEPNLKVMKNSFGEDYNE